MSKITELISAFEKLSGTGDFEFGPKSSPAAIKKISELETLIGEPLPQDMKEFYLITNGWYSIDGRYGDIFPIEEVIEGINDSDTKSMCLVGSSGPNDFYIFMYTGKTTGAGLKFIVEDWFEEVQLSEKDLQTCSTTFKEKMLNAAESSAEEGKYLSPPYSFTEVLEHLLKYNATKV